MVEIIRNRDKKQVKCNSCESILQYTSEDVKIDRIAMNEYSNYIECPVCGNKITNPQYKEIDKSNQK